jgi:hypothetical protein
MLGGSVAIAWLPLMLAAGVAGLMTMVRSMKAGTWPVGAGLLSLAVGVLVRSWAIVSSVALAVRDQQGDPRCSVIAR